MKIFFKKPFPPHLNPLPPRERRLFLSPLPFGERVRVRGYHKSIF
jgi:hypothetical protein